MDTTNTAIIGNRIDLRNRLSITISKENINLNKQNSFKFFEKRSVFYAKL